MSPLLLAGLLSSLGWTADVGLSDKIAAPIEVSGDNAPGDLVLLKKKKKVTLKVDGPGSIAIELFGVRIEKGRKKKLTPPGKVTVKLKRKKKKTKLSKTVLTDWAVPDQATWRVTEPATVQLDLKAGTNKILLKADRKARAGYLMRVTLTRPGDEPETEAVAEAEAAGEDDLPIPPMPEGPEAAALADASAETGDELPPLPGMPGEDELPLAGPDDGPDDEPDDEPDLPLSAEGGDIDIPDSPLNVSTADETPKAFEVLAPVPDRVSVEDPAEVVDFFQVEVMDDFRVSVSGPGSMVFEVHAYRSEARQETLDPVVVGLLVDDVLVQTVSLDQDVNPAYALVASQENLSERVTLRVPVGAGRHDVGITLSDNAVMGMLVLPRFDDVAEVVEPAPPPQQILVERKRPTVEGASNIGVIGGVWFPASMPNIGPMGILEANLGWPISNMAISIGLSGGFAQNELASSFADDRTLTGSGAVQMKVFTVPVFADLRWTVAATSWFKVAIGGGGGVLLTWADRRALDVQTTTDIKAAPTGVAHLSLMFAVGPGDIVVRGMYVPAAKVDSAVVRDFSPGGAFASLGYQFGL